MSRLAVFLLTACLGVNAIAADIIDPNRQKEFGDITVHYNTFTSSFLQPDVAQAVELVRSKNKGVINVSVIKAGEPVIAQVTGTIKDLSGKSEMKGIRIDPALLNGEEGEILEDLIVAAHADAKSKAEQRTADEMKELTGGLNLPPGFNMPFGGCLRRPRAKVHT